MDLAIGHDQGYPVAHPPTSVIAATFYTSAASLVDLPAESQAEVAFVGRSNAGKSSAINALANQRRLAHVSKTPGRTQHLNYFRVGPGRFLVDLPGYGYARAPLPRQRSWQSLAGDYLISRPVLRGLILIMDIRHPLTELDRQLLDWWRQTGKPVHVLLSKADKLSRSQGLTALHAVRAFLAEEGLAGQAQVFSAMRRLGLDALEVVLRAWLDLPLAAGEGARLVEKKPGQGDTAGSNEP